MDGWALDLLETVLLLLHHHLFLVSPLPLCVLYTGSNPDSWAAVFVSWSGEGGPAPFSGCDSALLQGNREGCAVHALTAPRQP